MTEALLPIYSRIASLVHLHRKPSLSVRGTFSQHNPHLADLTFGGFRTRSRSAATLDIHVLLTLFLVFSMCVLYRISIGQSLIWHSEVMSIPRQHTSHHSVHK